ncbi:MAG: hypothetical protein K2W96_26740 [Gemmataceae bacterium]|nr:hypothetical protein [Gemmataceae bacterium]
MTPLLCLLLSAPTITVKEDEWGGAPPTDIEAVCRSVASELAPFFPGRKFAPILVGRSKGAPIALFKRTAKSEIRIDLNSSGTRWAQFAYQFGHELGHVLCNFREADNPNLWFEEALCETASLFAIRRMAKTWRTKPPYRNWKGYADALAAYADEYARLHPRPREPLPRWLRENEVGLRRIDRKRIHAVAAHVLLPMLEKEPGHWQALDGLNRFDPKKRLSFAEYLDDWRGRVPEERQAFVAAIAEAFGVLDRPAAPKEFAFVLSNGYGEADRMPTDPKAFGNLLANMKKAGFNAIHCVHRKWRADLCRKHGVRMMVDVLAWKDGVRADIRRPEQRAFVKNLVARCRGDDAVWGYNLWNEALPHFGRPDGRGIDDYVRMLRQWDPTHPVWMGTRTVSYADAPKSKPGVHGYYDYAWQRGFHWHFADLAWYHRHVPTQDGWIGRWEQGSDYSKNSFSLNTSIAFGTKATIWFIGGPFDKDGEIDPKHRFHHLVKLGQETMRLYPEIGKIGRPSAVYSTLAARTHDDKPRKEKAIPQHLAAFPEGFWFRIEEGEALAGFFRYPTGEDAVFVANNNAYARQRVVFALDGKRRAELFDRATGEWKELEADGGRHSFALAAGGGELLRVGKPR